MKAEQVLTADYDWTDEPLNVDNIDGLREAVEQVRETKEKVFVQCDDRVTDYGVYWNEKTDAVRIAAQPVCASYEVSDDATLGDFE